MWGGITADDDDDSEGECSCEELSAHEIVDLPAAPPQTTVTITLPNRRGQSMASISKGLKNKLWADIIGELVAGGVATNSPELNRLLNFYESVFPKWVFHALSRNDLHELTFQLMPGKSLLNIIQPTDLKYFTEVHKISLKPLPKPEPRFFELITPAVITLVELNHKQKVRLMALYTGQGSPMSVGDELRAFYDGLGGGSNLLSVPPGIKEGYIELFGSPFNTDGEYCSVLALEKEYFRSLGSFFDYELVSGRNYLANPPFDELLMENMARRLDEQLAKTTDVTVVVLIPVWRKMPYTARDILNASPFRKERAELNRDTYFYYDPVSGKYASICNSFIFVLSNSQWNDTKMSVKSIMGRWAAEVRKNRQC